MFKRRRLKRFVKRPVGDLTKDARGPEIAFKPRKGGGLTVNEVIRRLTIIARVGYGDHILSIYEGPDGEGEGVWDVENVEIWGQGATIPQADRAVVISFGNQWGD